MPDKVLLIVIDQFRSDCLIGALADVAPLPHLQALMSEATSFENHFTVTTPCGPSRASLLTGLYAMNHRSVRNGTPLSSRHETLGTHMRSAGYEPMLFGYTDSSADPMGLHPNDPDLKNYEGLAPGFAEIVRLRFENPGSWVGYLKRKGYKLPTNYWDLYRPPLDKATANSEDPEGSPIRSPALYRAEDSDTAFLTDRTLEELSARESDAWFSMVTYIRPHPPFVAPAPYNSLYSPGDIPPPHLGKSITQSRDSHPFHDAYFSEPSNNGLYIGFNGDLTTLSAEHTAELRAVYLGLAKEVDDHIGRLIKYLRDSGQYDNTLIVVTADHGEMLGDQHLWGKSSPFDAALRIPLIIRDPRQPTGFGKCIRAFTESVDITPTLTDWANTSLRRSFDGRSLLPLIGGGIPENWREYVFCEAELGELDKASRFQKKWQLPAQQANFAVLRSNTHKYVHFNGGIPPLFFDIENDQHELNNLASEKGHQQNLQEFSSRMLDHRMTHANRVLSDCQLSKQGLYSV
ncbi:MAG: alkaline phosphatase family protein [Granulosicoccus sp.]